MSFLVHTSMQYNQLSKNMAGYLIKFAKVHLFNPALLKDTV